jgi:hypothetical protein
MIHTFLVLLATKQVPFNSRNFNKYNSMNKKQRAIIEKSSEVLEEKNLNYKKFWGWGVGLILVLMAIAYFAGLITFGVPKKATEAKRKAYFHKDSTTKAAIAAMDSTKK